jgi:hypothetical protein
MAIAGRANDSPAIPDWYLAVSFTLCTDLACFYVDDGSSTIGMILHVIFNHPLAVLPSIGLTCGARNFPRFPVLKFNDELPFGNDGDLSHAHRLYVDSTQNTRSCMRKVLSDLFGDSDQCMLLQANQLLHLS